jgi:acetyltransferase-like isoleucine patch superfamily enzyme
VNLMYLISKLIKKIQIPSIKNSKIDKTSKINANTQIVNTTIGRYSYTGYNCMIIETHIGNFCSIANNVVIGGANHPIDWVSTSPVFHQGKNTLNKNFSNHEFNTYKKTIIGNDVWIGNNSLIKSGLIIGHGAIIGMGSVVTKNIGNYEIWAGNPAKLIRKRFSDEYIQKILEIGWWDFEDDKIHEISKEFDQITKFFIKD